MRHLFILLILTFSLASCSLGDDGDDFYYEILPVESVDIPSEFTFGETYEMHISYLRPSNCHVFNDFYYVSELNQRTIAVINTVYPNRGCEDLENNIVEVSFNFIVNNNGTYVFRFWQGEDDNGNDMYYIVEVPVVE